MARSQKSCVQTLLRGGVRCLKAWVHRTSWWIQMKRTKKPQKPFGNVQPNTAVAWKEFGFLWSSNCWKRLPILLYTSLLQNWKENYGIFQPWLLWTVLLTSSITFGRWEAGIFVWDCLFFAKNGSNVYDLDMFEAVSGFAPVRFGSSDFMSGFAFFLLPGRQRKCQDRCQSSSPKTFSTRYQNIRQT